MMDMLLDEQSNPRAWRFLVPMTLASFLPIYDLADSLEELLAEPYRQQLPHILNGSTLDPATMAGLMPVSEGVFSILRPGLREDFRSNPDNPWRRAFSDNNVYDWAPNAPIRMFHCRADQLVPFANSQVAYDSFTNRGACCVELIDPGAPAEFGHDLPCYLASLREALAWFEPLRR
jgi:hypothetical protein